MLKKKIKYLEIFYKITDIQEPNSQKMYMSLLLDWFIDILSDD